MVCVCEVVRMNLAVAGGTNKHGIFSTLTPPPLDPLLPKQDETIAVTCICSWGVAWRRRLRRPWNFVRHPAKFSEKNSIYTSKDFLAGGMRVWGPR